MAGQGVAESPLKPTRPKKKKKKKKKKRGLALGEGTWGWPNPSSRLLGPGGHPQYFFLSFFFSFFFKRKK